MGPKIIIAPLQSWLLKRGMCVGCGAWLKNGKKVKHPESGSYQVSCGCRRVYIYKPEGNSYRRALMEEVV